MKKSVENKVKNSFQFTVTETDNQNEAEEETRPENQCRSFQRRTNKDFFFFFLNCDSNHERDFIKMKKEIRELLTHCALSFNFDRWISSTFILSNHDLKIVVLNF